MSEGQPRGHFKRGIERRRLIVITATDVFGEHGFKGGTLQKVADVVGGTPAAILKLFGSKEKLLIAVLDYWGESTSKLVMQGSPEIAYLDGLSALMRYHVAHKGLLQLYTTMAAEGASAQHPAHEFMTNRYRNTLANMRKRFADASHAGHLKPMSEEEIDREAEYLLATMDGLEIQFILNPEFDLVRSFDEYVNRVTARLRVHGSSKA
jgi:AcrR family transcriptional regulator